MERGGQQWRVMEDCSTDERLQQEMLCRRQWTDEYVKHPETLRYINGSIQMCGLLTFKKGVIGTQCIDIVVNELW